MIDANNLPDSRPWTREEVAAWLHCHPRTIGKRGIPKLDGPGALYDPAVVKASIGWGKHRQQFKRSA